jgi:hypothetical protein
MISFPGQNRKRLCSGMVLTQVTNIYNLFTTHVECSTSAGNCVVLST